MPNSERYVQIFRRRREGKTDYRKRRGVILGREPFLSVRVSGKYVYGQVLRATATGDVTLCAASSRDLRGKFGWKGSPKSIPGAYLTGLYLGRLAQEKGLDDVVVYSGLNRFVHGSRIASLISGAKEAGLNIEIDEESLPDEERIKGEHIAAYAKSLEESDKERYDRTFSGLVSSGLNPAEYASHFDQVRSAINGGKGSGATVSRPSANKEKEKKKENSPAQKQKGNKSSA